MAASTEVGTKSLDGQSLTEFLNDERVPFWPIVYRKDNAGKKRPVRGMGPGWQNVNVDEAARRRAAEPDGNAININWHKATSGLFCVFDCDHPDAPGHFSLMVGGGHDQWSDLMHTLSVSKGLPHFIVELPSSYEPPSTAVKWIVDGVELGDIKFTNTWERTNAVIIGEALPVLNPEWLPGLEQKPPTPAPAPAASPAAPAPAAAASTTPSDANNAIEHARNISAAQLDERGQWITFIAACANCGVPQSICLEVSARSSKHRPEPDAKTVTAIYSQSSWRAGMGTLCRLSKLSDPENFYRLQSKHFWGPEVEASLIDCEFSDTAYAKSFLSLCARTVGWTRMGELTCYDDETGLWCLGKKAEAMIRNQICDTLQRLLLHKIPNTADKAKREEMLKRSCKIGQQTKRKALFECVCDLAYQQCAQFDIDRKPRH